MAINLKTLLQIAPFPQDQREKILAGFQKLTDDQKNRLSNAAWNGIFQQYQNQLQFRRDSLLLEVEQGKRQATPQDWEKLDEEVTKEFIDKFKQIDEQVSLDDVRQQLKTMSSSKTQ